MSKAKVIKLNNIIKNDNRFYFVKNIEMDLVFARIGWEVTVDNAFQDDEFPSGVGVHIKIKNSGKEYDIDADLLVPRKQWVDLYNVIARKAAGQMGLDY